MFTILGNNHIGCKSGVLHFSRVMRMKKEGQCRSSCVATRTCDLKKQKVKYMPAFWNDELCGVCEVIWNPELPSDLEFEAEGFSRSFALDLENGKFVIMSDQAMQSKGSNTRWRIYERFGMQYPLLFIFAGNCLLKIYFQLNKLALALTLLHINASLSRRNFEWQIRTWGLRRPNISPW